MNIKSLFKPVKAIANHRLVSRECTHHWVKGAMKGLNYCTRCGSFARMEGFTYGYHRFGRYTEAEEVPATEMRSLLPPTVKRRVLV